MAKAMERLGILAFALRPEVTGPLLQFDFMGAFDALLALGESYLSGPAFDEFLELVKRVGKQEIMIALIFALKDELVALVKEGI